MNPTETKLLQKISSYGLITKAELLKFLAEEEKLENPKGILESSLRVFEDSGYVNVINPVGSTCLVITHEGSKAAASCLTS